ncbi:uncharacterized protein B0I36DRAFT_137180 [Microdochium trichocladiopsis]|uniref:Uncharacterized protein n=1 Tax=Microdochium trichocladiopsis TaxID=1682393 RepID=A0A9P8Y1U1_9PEZI|nr:uncharacterized protein B0I36DRAFT_137180 [Microdochium trichocladiopsis]KAH7027304.1 hypothetical protein B0I36DRAFT_137180 [Microdochium trichocladiopsis]
MLRDAPYAPDGMHFIVRKCCDGGIAGNHDDKDPKKSGRKKDATESINSDSTGTGTRGTTTRGTRHRIIDYFKNTILQRNPGKVRDYVDDPNALAKAWKAFTDDDGEFEAWLQRQWAKSAGLDGRKEREVAEELLDWPSLMVHEAINGPGLSSPPNSARRSPEQFWQELVALQIQQVVVDEGVEGRMLRTQAGDGSAPPWAHRGQQGSRHVAQMIVREIYAEERDVTAFRFGDY